MQSTSACLLMVKTLRKHNATSSLKAMMREVLYGIPNAEAKIARKWLETPIYSLPLTGWAR